MRLLLDTCAYSAMKRGDPALARLVRNAHEVILSAVVVGELLLGFRRGTRETHNRRELEDFSSSPFVRTIPVTSETAERFAIVASALRDAGRPIPTNDVWIAAHALETGATLVSFDAHFAAVSGLVWVDPART